MFQLFLAMYKCIREGDINTKGQKTYRDRIFFISPFHKKEIGLVNEDTTVHHLKGINMQDNTLGNT